MRKLIFLLLGIVATPLAWLVGALMSGGHNYAVMLALFPWGMLLDLSFEGLSWWAVVMPVFAIQYPLYGLLLGYALERRKLAHFLIALSVAHVLAALICFAVDPKSSWKIFL
jgi:hypothetical protein